MTYIIVRRRYHIAKLREKRLELCSFYLATRELRPIEKIGNIGRRCRRGHGRTGRSVSDHSLLGQMRPPTKNSTARNSNILERRIQNSNWNRAVRRQRREGKRETTPKRKFSLGLTLNDPASLGCACPFNVRTWPGKTTSVYAGTTIETKTCTAKPVQMPSLQRGHELVGPSSSPVDHTSLTGSSGGLISSKLTARVTSQRKTTNKGAHSPKTPWHHWPTKNHSVKSGLHHTDVQLQLRAQNREAMHLTITLS